MQVETQAFIRLATAAKSLVFFDIETTGLNGDYNSILCVSLKPIGCRPFTFAVEKPGKDRTVVKAAIEALSEYDCWGSYYGKGFDVLMLNTRALRWNLSPLPKKPHIDMYWAMRAHTKTSRRSQAHFLEWLRISSSGILGAETLNGLVQKKTVSADEWNQVLANPQRTMRTMIRRCESDVAGLEALFLRTKHLIRDIRA
jgi:uncharacterized protein YprB with RNaseH-like and TPR domain